MLAGHDGSNASLLRAQCFVRSRPMDSATWLRMVPWAVAWLFRLCLVSATPHAALRQRCATCRVRHVVFCRPVLRLAMRRHAMPRHAMPWLLPAFCSDRHHWGVLYSLLELLGFLGIIKFL